MSVRKRILVSGEIRWQVDYRDQKGKRRSRQFETQKEAKNYETTVRGEIRAGTHVSDSASVTVAKASELWLDRCRLDQLEAGTVRNYRQHLNLHILPSLGAVKLSRLTRPVVESFKDQLLEKCSRSTAAKVMVSLKSLLADAQRRGLAVQNVASGVTVKLAGRHEKRIEIPTKDDIRAMLNVAGELWQPTEPWRALIVTAVFSGLRSSELRGLVWDNVDFDRRIIQVRQRADFRNQMGSPKSKAGTRDVPMAPLALNTLRQWKLACPKTEAGLVFPTKNLNVICHAEMHRAWNQLLQAVGLPRLRYRFHDLRHVGASLFIEQGWSPKKVMAVMGHGSIQMTFDLYGHLWATPEDDAAAMAQIEARLLR